MIASLVWGAPQWLVPVALLALTAVATLAWSYRRAAGPARTRVVAALLKAAGIGVLALCLLDPLSSTHRPRKGANLFVVVADNSQSLQVFDKDEPQSRADQMQSQLLGTSHWQTRLSDDF